MKWLPHDSWIITSPLNVNELIACMNKQIAPKKKFRWCSQKQTPFHGTVYNKGFSVTRVICYPNLFLPYIQGRFITEKTGTTICINMTLHPLVIISIALLLCILALFILSGILVLFQTKHWNSIPEFFGIGLFIIILAYVCYWIEAGKTKAILSQTFQKIHNESNKNSENNKK